MEVGRGVGFLGRYVGDRDMTGARVGKLVGMAAVKL